MLAMKISLKILVIQIILRLILILLIILIWFGMIGLAVLVLISFLPNGHLVLAGQIWMG